MARQSKLPAFRAIWRYVQADRYNSFLACKMKFGGALSLVMAWSLSACSSFSTYASLGTCDPETPDGVLPEEIAKIVAEAAAQFDLIPDGNSTFNGRTFATFQTGAGDLHPNERIVIQVSLNDLIVRITDYKHAQRTKTLEALETQIATPVASRYKCFHFIRYRMATDF